LPERKCNKGQVRCQKNTVKIGHGSGWATFYDRPEAYLGATTLTSTTSTNDSERTPRAAGHTR
jgi:hypothetical protein